MTESIRPACTEPHATYKIVRMYQAEGRKSRTIKKDLTLEEAQAHCRRDDTHGPGWFDGYEVQR